MQNSLLESKNIFKRGIYLFICSFTRRGNTYGRHFGVVRFFCSEFCPVSMRGGWRQQNDTFWIFLVLCWFLISYLQQPLERSLYKLA